MTRFGRGQRGICGEHLYSHFFSEGHSGLTDVSVQIMVKRISEIQQQEKDFGHINQSALPLWGLILWIFNLCKDIVYTAAIYGEEI